MSFSLRKERKGREKKKEKIKTIVENKFSFSRKTEGYFTDQSLFHTFLIKRSYTTDLKRTFFCCFVWFLI